MIQVAEYPGLAVDFFGNVWSKGGPLKPFLDSKGYPTIGYYPKGKRKPKQVAVHKLMSLVFLPGKTNSRALCRHLDDNPLNMSPYNLAWGSYYDNTMDAFKNGGRKRGEGMPAAKITDADSIEIRRLHKEAVAGNGGIAPYGFCVALAKSRGVSVAAIRHVISGRSFKHTL